MSVEIEAKFNCFVRDVIMYNNIYFLSGPTQSGRPGLSYVKAPPSTHEKGQKASQFSKRTGVDGYQGDQFPESQQHQVLGVSSLSLAS